jgi:hypothetical protein
LNCRRDHGGLFQDRRGKVVGKIVFMDDDLRIQAGVVRVAQDFQDLSFGTFYPGWIAGDLRQDHLILPRSPGSLFRDADGLDEPLFIGHDPVPSGSFLIPAHHPAVGPFQDLDDSRPLFSAPLFPGEMKGHLIPVHEVLHLPRGKEEVREAGVLGNQESIAVPMGLDPADDNLSLRGKAVMTAVQFYDLPLVNQGPKSLAQFFPPGGVHIKGLSDVGEGKGLAFSGSNGAKDFFEGRWGRGMFFFR